MAEVVQSAKGRGYKPGGDSLLVQTGFMHDGQDFTGSLKEKKGKIEGAMNTFPHCGDSGGYITVEEAEELLWKAKEASAGLKSVKNDKLGELVVEMVALRPRLERALETAKEKQKATEKNATKKLVAKMLGVQVVETPGSDGDESLEGRDGDVESQSDAEEGPAETVGGEGSESEGEEGDENEAEEGESGAVEEEKEEPTALEEGTAPVTAGGAAAPEELSLKLAGGWVARRIAVVHNAQGALAGLDDVVTLGRAVLEGL